MSVATGDTFENRRDAGKRLAERLLAYGDNPKVIVLGLPRGGVPVAFEIAQRLHVSLDVFIVRKVGVPGHAELAMGAIASGGAQYFNERIIRETGVSDVALAEVIRSENEELERRERLFREGRPALALSGRTVILVDDGLATGASMRVAVSAVRAMRPAELIVAVPVIAADSVSSLRAEVDEIVYVLAPRDFHAVGQWYLDFGQTTDDEVRELLSQT